MKMQMTWKRRAITILVGSAFIALSAWNAVVVIGSASGVANSVILVAHVVATLGIGILGALGIVLALFYAAHRHSDREGPSANDRRDVRRNVAALVCDEAARFTELQPLRSVVRFRPRAGGWNVVLRVGATSRSSLEALLPSLRRSIHRSLVRETGAPLRRLRVRAHREAVRAQERAPRCLPIRADEHQPCCA